MPTRMWRTGAAAVIAALAATAMLQASRAQAAGLTPNSPEVKQAVDKAVQFLETTAQDDRLGAKALAGLTLVKYGAQRSHPRIVAAVTAIQDRVRGRKPAEFGIDVYSTGLSIIFLVTLDPSQYEPEISALLAYLQVIQKPHGGWGYANRETGDTSMTQYGVLSSWEAAQAGFPVPQASIEKVTHWLLKTQDPAGAFGYQGTVSTTGARTKQAGVRHSMAAAGLGSLYIAANLLGMSDKIEHDEDLPKALEEVRKPLDRKTQVSPRAVHDAQMLGNTWIRTNYKIDPPQWTHYYLYALERYYSFREAAEGEREGKWYSDGARFLIRTQADDGSWHSKAGVEPDTAFAVLFLLRSSKKSIEHAYYYHTSVLTGHRGLPRDTRRVELRAGRVVARPPVDSPEWLLAALADPEHAEHDVAIDTLAALPRGEARALVAQHGDQLRTLARQGASPVRAAALRSLGTARNLDYVPAFIRALLDPDLAVAREAGVALQRVSRRTGEPEITEQTGPDQRQAVCAKWKAWYLSVRPDAEFDD